MAQSNSYRPRLTPPNPRYRYQNSNENEQQSPLPLLIPVQIQSPGNFNNPRLPIQNLEKHLPYRTWSNTTYLEYFRREHLQHFKIHLVCYNILSQDLLEDNSYLYGNSYRNNLKWFKRKDRLIRELLRQDADILCLQEVQCDHYENTFRPILRDEGYESIYLKRSGDKSDGCSIFYKINRFKLVQSKVVSFYQPNIQMLDRDNCGLIALFQPLAPNATSDDLFCVATTHLLFSPKRGDIKLAQVQYFLAEIDRISRKNDATNVHYPIILCGDFNAYPQSPLIQFLLGGYIKYDTYRCIDISGQLPGNGFSHPLPTHELLPSAFVTSDCRLPTTDTNVVSHIRINKKSSTVLTHDKQFLSVYDVDDPLGVTTNVDDEHKAVDFILYTQQDNDSSGLNLLSRLDLYKKNQMADIHLPNHQFPSDHFLLSAKFALKLRK